MSGKREADISLLDDNLSSMLQPTEIEQQPVSDGTPLELELALIDGNPLNRTDVSEEFKKELTEDIRKNRVKEPISVREHPTISGRYMINSGHTRKECSERAGKTTIPAFIDNDFDDYDMIKVNIKRERQSPLSIAEFIQRKIEEGEPKGDIAAKLGKSPAFISQHVGLLSLPSNLDAVFKSGRCTDVTLINDLVRLQKKNPESVESWIEDDEQDITRNSFKQLKGFIKHKTENSLDDDEEYSEVHHDEHIDAPEENSSQPKKARPSQVMNKYIIRILYDGKEGELAPKVRPTDKGLAYIRLDGDTKDLEVEAQSIKILSITDA